MRVYLLFITIWIGMGLVFSQSTYIPLNEHSYHMIDRYEIKSGELNEDFHTAVKPYSRREVVHSLDKVDSSNLSDRDEFNIQYLKDDSWEWSLDSSEWDNAKKAWFKAFYKNKADLYYHKSKDFDLHINPVLYFGGGRELDADQIFINTRGVELRGMIDDKVGFYTFLTENQYFFPSYVNDRIEKYDAVPDANFWKPFKEGGYDFFNARGYINFNFTKHISTQFGHDKNAFGDGYRSLINSDYAGANTFWKINLNVWKLNYQVIYNFMNTGQTTNPAYQTVTHQKKYNVFHHLSMNVLKNLNIGVFETVTYGCQDSTGNGCFEVAYLNPIIFYRSIEGNLGSSNGNAILGLNFKYNFLKHFSLYGQGILDEFKLDEVRAGNGWWANKWGIQIGAKYIDAFGLKNLDLQGEYNVVRPYTYTHSQSKTSYSHYGQSLAHPLGANFNEMVGIIRYQPAKRLFASSKLIYARIGLDTLNSNWGQNLLLPYTTREQEYGNEIGQGITTNMYYIDLNLTYMLRHNLFIDFRQVYRKENSEIPALSKDSYFFSAAIRLNLAARQFEY